MVSRSFDIAIRGDASSAISAFAATQGAALKTQARVGGAMGVMRANAGKMAAGMALIGAAAVVGLAKLGNEFAQATDIIRTGTGATGKALEGLERDFKKTLTRVPASFDDAATAIADLNTRLGLTGKPLQKISGQFLELSRITKTDLGDNIASVTRLFGDWGIKTEDMSPTLDKLFRASQATGIEVSRLSELMVQFGSPLRQLGVDFDFATAMFANFEKSGVATETLMPGMRFALKNLSGATPKVTEELKALGISTDDVQTGLQDTFEKIRQAGSAAEANQIAFKVFGVRAGPDMAAAIREGRFDLDELQKTIVSGKDTVEKAGKATMTFTERWTLFKNRIAVALEPIATKLFEVFERGLEIISNPKYTGAIVAIGLALLGLVIVVPVISAVVTAIGGLIGVLTFLAAHPIVLLVAALVAAGVAIFVFRDEIVSGLTKIRDFFQSVMGVVAAVILIPIAPIVALTALIVSNWDLIRSVTMTVVDALVTAWGAVRGAIETAISAIVTAWGAVRGAVETAVMAVVAAAQTVVSWFTGTFIPFWVAVWNAVRGPLMGFLNVVQTVFSIMFAIMFSHIIAAAAFILSHWEKIRDFTVVIFNIIRTVVEAIVGAFVAFIMFHVNAAVFVVTGAWNVLRTVTVAIWEAIGAFIGLVWRNVIRPVWDAIIAFINVLLIPVFRGLRDFMGRVWEQISNVISGAWTFIRDEVLAPIGNWIETNVVDKFRSMRDAMGRIWAQVKETASSVWESIVRAMKGPINSIIGFINSLIGGINRVLDLIPGIDLKIPEIPKLGAASGRTPTSRRPRSSGSRGSGGAQLAEGGMVPIGRAGPFMTSGPTAVVGEGRRQHPEFVIPTDPQFRGRALGLTEQLMGSLGVPGMAIGGVVGDWFDAGKKWVGDRVEAAGGFLGDLARKAIIEIYRPINNSVKAALNAAPNPLHLADAMQGVRETIWQWVRGADEGLPDAATWAGIGGSGSGPIGSGVERWRATALQALRMTGSPLSWISSLLRRMNQESGGNPRAINLTDINAQRGDPSMGLMQNIPSAYASRVAGFPSLRGTSPFHPLGSIVASIVYANQRYGSAPRGWNRAGGYAMGGFVDKAGMAHPGELVLNRSQQVRMLQAIGGGGRSGSMVVNIEPGAIVVHPPLGMGEAEARRLGGALEKGFEEKLFERQALADARNR